MCWVLLRHAMCFFFNDTATTDMYTLSLHDALPIWAPQVVASFDDLGGWRDVGSALSGLEGDGLLERGFAGDRKSTRLNSSHLGISYAVSCLKKKNSRNASGALPSATFFWPSGVAAS